MRAEEEQVRMSRHIDVNDDAQRNVFASHEKQLFQNKMAPRTMDGKLWVNDIALPAAKTKEKTKEKRKR